jgi:GT2 family glycosyltransferase
MVPSVQVVVLNWNKEAETRQCVGALQLQTFAPLKIIVVDNGSTESLAEPLSAFPNPPRLIVNKRNLGFTGGVNAGISAALADGADYIWLLNNDTKPEPDAIARLVSAMRRDPRVGLASPVITNGDAGNRIEFCGGLFDPADMTFGTTNRLETYRHWAKATPDRMWLVGTALLLSRIMVERVGLFDTRFFAYWEDNDYSIRSVQAGFRSLVVPEAIVEHRSGDAVHLPCSKPPHYFYYMARNEILFRRKHPSEKRLKSLWWCLNRHCRAAAGLAGERRGAVLGGLRDGLMGRGGAYMPDRVMSPRAADAVLRSLAMVSR